MVQLVIRGHATRGKEVIEILEMLGGKSYTALPYQGDDIDRYYYINKGDNYINAEPVYRTLVPRFQSFTLEEFLEKFPYKVGDRIKIPNCDVACRVTNMIWNGIEIEYETTNSEETFFADELQPYKEETMEEIKIAIPKGYEFTGVDDDKQQVIFTRKQPRYPKTYKECIGKLSIDWDSNVKGYKSELLEAFQKLLIARDVYWKIAGEQMGLGGPWRPSKSTSVYCIFRLKGEIVKDNFVFGDSLILEFPTEEMRDVFYENFNDLIEQCKELL